jgi:hypothetical protein
MHFLVHVRLPLRVPALSTKERFCAHAKAPDYVPNTAQRLLAAEVTRFVHGEEGLQQALKATQVGSGWRVMGLNPMCMWWCLFLKGRQTDR